MEFNAPATGFINGGGALTDPGYLANQNWTVWPGAAGNVAVIGADTLDAYVTGPAAPWTLLQPWVLVVLQRDLGGVAGGSVVGSSHRHLGDRRRTQQRSGCGA